MRGFKYVLRGFKYVLRGFKYLYTLSALLAVDLRGFPLYTYIPILKNSASLISRQRGNSFPIALVDLKSNMIHFMKQTKNEPQQAANKETRNAKQINMQEAAVREKIGETYRDGQVNEKQKKELLDIVPKIASDIAAKGENGFTEFDELSTSSWEDWMFTHQDEYQD